jgi:putative spermidine/putrescine transport system substrate-binding protein
MVSIPYTEIRHLPTSRSVLGRARSNAAHAEVGAMAKDTVLDATHGRFSRRRFLQGTVFTALAGSVAVAHRTLAASGPIIVGSRGGYIGQAEKDIIWDPFSKQSGVEVIQFEAPDTDAIIKAQEEAGKVQLSYSITTDAGYKVLSEAGYLEKLDYSKFSPTARKVVESMAPGTVRPYGLAVSTIGVNIGFDRRKFPDGRPQPKTWADFWDVQKFPGRRGLYNGPNFSLEVALLADGVEPARLYPLDVERAFKKLALIKPHVAKWWDAGAQAPQLLIDGEAAAVMAYNGRLEGAIEGGAQIGYSWEGALTYHDLSIIPKGAPHLDSALAALSFMYEPNIAAAISEKTRYPIPSTLVWEAAPKGKRDRWPNAPSNASQLVKMDFLWWAQPAPGGGGKTLQESLGERFAAFVASPS